MGKYSKPKTSDVITDEMIEDWKKKHDEIFIVEVEDKVAYLHTPSRKVLRQANVHGKTDDIKFAEIILNNCWLGGDEIIKTDDSYFLGVASELSQIIDIKEATIKKL